ncbi:MAG: HD domain-containing protein, partial [Pseudomonadales bacterium]
MVKATDTIPRLPDGRVDVEAWSRRLDTDQQTGTGLIASSLSLIRGLDARSDELLERGLELANLVLVLNMDPQSVSAALLYLPVRTGALTLDQVRVVTGAEVASLVEAVVRLADTSLLEMSSSRMQASESRNQ